MEFRIDFVSCARTRRQPNGVAVGKIQIGSFSETFEVALNYWRQPDYRRQWYTGIKRIVDGSTTSCLITSIVDPSTANFIHWWPIYRVDEEVVFQNHLLFMDAIAGGQFQDTDPYRFVPERETVSDDGESVSEWVAPLQSLKQFLEGADHE